MISVDLLKRELLSEDEVIEIVGNQTIDNLKKLNCEMTGRIFGNELEFTASIQINDNTEVTAFYLQNKDIVMDCEDLGILEWNIEGFGIIYK